MDTIYTYLRQEDWCLGREERISVCMWVKGGGHYEYEHPKFMLFQGIKPGQNAPVITAITDEAHVDPRYLNFRVCIFCGIVLY